jgi:hypothetical protein
MNKVAEAYLNIVRDGFSFKDVDKDLAMVKSAREFTYSLTFEQSVDLVEGLDDVLMGKKWR